MCHKLNAANSINLFHLQHDLYVFFVLFLVVLMKCNICKVRRSRCAISVLRSSIPQRAIDSTHTILLVAIVWLVQLRDIYMTYGFVFGRSDSRSKHRRRGHRFLSSLQGKVAIVFHVILIAYQLLITENCRKIWASWNIWAWMLSGSPFPGPGYYPVRKLRIWNDLLSLDSFPR